MNIVQFVQYVKQQLKKGAACMHIGLPHHEDGFGQQGTCALPCMQVCLFDLDYGLPVQVRDTALGIEKEDIPESDVGKEFQLNEQIQKGQVESSFGGKATASDMLLHLQRTTPYYKVLGDCGVKTEIAAHCARLLPAESTNVCNCNCCCQSPGGFISTCLQHVLSSGFRSHVGSSWLDCRCARKVLFVWV